MGEILECIFGAIYYNKAKWSLVMLIHGLCSAHRVIIFNLIIIMKYELGFKCIVNYRWSACPVQGGYITGKFKNTNVEVPRNVHLYGPCQNLLK